MERSKSWYRHLRNEAHRLLAGYALQKGLARIEDVTLPVPLAEIATDILRYDFRYSAQLEPEVSGLVDFDQEIIRISTQYRTPEHQHFSFGHEIGHVCLHRHDGITRHYRCTRETIGSPSEATSLGVEWTRLDTIRFIQLHKEEKQAWQRKRREIEANVFASALVVPTAHLAQLTPTEQQNVVELARRFGVSVPAMGWRLAEWVGPEAPEQPSLFSL